MRNILLEPRTSTDIDRQVARIHRDLDYNGGRVELAEVRELLKLDLKYYQANDTHLLGEVVHRIKVGAKQVIQRPMLLIEAALKFELKALFVPDRKQILISQDLPDKKKRWSEGHEILHSVIPWHADYMLGDTATTLSPACHDQIEAEANYGSGRLLFPRSEFEEFYRSRPANFALVQAIAAHFGNSITSTLWRCVEFDNAPAFGVIGGHPTRPQEGKPDIEYLIRSPSFVERFGGFDEPLAIQAIRRYCGSQRAGPLGSANVPLIDVNGDEHIFFSETFCNSYNTLTLARYVRANAKTIASSRVSTRIA